jgi:hypothetical protein
MITVDMVAKAYEDKRTGRIAIEEDRRWGWSEEMIPEWIARLPPIEAGEAAGYRQHLHDLSYRELVYKYLSFYSSSGRVMPLYFALEGAPPEVFWPLLTEQWPGLDATWHISGCYLKMLRARPEIVLTISCRKTATSSIHFPPQSKSSAAARARGCAEWPGH